MCPRCRREPGERPDAREASKESGVDVSHFRQCPDCHQLLTLEEEDRVRRDDSAARATVPED